MSLPPNVCAVKDRHGKTRHRFRKAGLPSAYLPGAPGSEEFNAVYDLCLRGDVRPSRHALRTARTEKRRKVDPFARWAQISVVYFVGDARSGTVKIGTTRNFRDRFKKLQIATPRKLKVLACVEGDAQTERSYHDRFKAHRIRGEWFANREEVASEIERLNGQPHFPIGVQPQCAD